MNILLTCQHYYPESFRVVDIAEELVKQGNSVTVLCGLPNYPEGKIYPEYRHGKNKTETRNGVKIVRSNIIPRGNNYFLRFLNYVSFPFFAIKELKKMNHDFDIVLAMNLSPVMMVKPALYYKKKYNTKVIMYEMDLWPSSLLAGGIHKWSLIYKHYEKVSRRLYSKADCILVASKPHITYITELIGTNIYPKISFLPQYSEETYSGVRTTKVKNFVFAGNLGRAQNLSTVIKAASLLRDREDIAFTFVGDGSDINNLKKLKKELDCHNVFFLGKQSKDHLNGIYINTYAMIVSLEDKEYARMTLPGKMQSYMRNGKAIVGAISGYTQEIIEESNCGLCVNAGDYKGFARIVTELADSPDISIYEQNSKKYYEENFSKDKFFDILNKKLEEYAK